MSFKKNLVSKVCFCFLYSLLSNNSWSQVSQRWNNNNELFPESIGCDTLFYSKVYGAPKQWAQKDWFSYGQTEGAVCGLNSASDKEKANYYNLSIFPATTYITGVFMRFSGAAFLHPCQIPVNIYDNTGAGGSPGSSAIASAFIHSDSIVRNVKNATLTWCSFNTPVQIPPTKSIYISIDLSQLKWTGTATTDSLAVMASDTLQEMPGIAWEKKSSGEWIPFSDKAKGWGLKGMAFHIFPCLSSNSLVPQIKLNINPPSADVCVGTPISLNLAGSLAPFGASWNISPGYSSIITSANGISLNYAVPGNYLVSAAAIGCGLRKEASVTIRIRPIPTLVSNISDIKACSGTLIPAQSLVSQPAGAVAVWQNTNTAIGLQNSGTGNLPFFYVQNNSNTTFTSSITVTPKLNGCLGAPKKIGVWVYPIPEVKATASKDTICAGDEVILTASGAISSVNWSPGTVVANPGAFTATAFPTQTTTFIVSAKDQHSCFNKDSVKVVVKICTALEERHSKTTFKLYYDSRNKKHVILKEGSSDTYLLKIYNMLGEVVKQEKLSFLNNSIEINSEGLAPGNYLLFLISNKEIITLKMMQPD